jgi:hypothetical protein
MQIRALPALLVVLAAVVTTPWIVAGQSGSPAIRLALLPQWSISQHRTGGASAPVRAELRTALDGGVVDRPVFWWQRGMIQRSALAWKPVRVLPAAQASVLGGRGEFELGPVRPPAGSAAWTEVEVRPRSAGAGDVLVLEVGGELNTITQVLNALFLQSSDGGFQELRLVPRAAVGAPGVPVAQVPFGQIPAEPAAFRGQDGIEFFVARSRIENLPDADTTTAGPADKAMTNVGDWREADRVFIRIPAARLQGGAPAMVLAWKDRTLKSDPDGGNGDDRRRSHLLRRLPG